jgi:hypothetical protein
MGYCPRADRRDGPVGSEQMPTADPAYWSPAQGTSDEIADLLRAPGLSYVTFRIGSLRIRFPVAA